MRYYDNIKNMFDGLNNDTIQDFFNILKSYLYYTGIFTSLYNFVLLPTCRLILLKFFHRSNLSFLDSWQIVIAIYLTRRINQTNMFETFYDEAIYQAIIFFIANPLRAFFLMWAYNIHIKHTVTLIGESILNGTRINYPVSFMIVTTAFLSIEVCKASFPS